MLPWPALALAGAVLAVSIAPAVAWYDSAELGAAAIGLDVAHPTGFPLLAFAGHAAGRMPLGEAGLRLHVLGACAALVAVALLAGAGMPVRARPDAAGAPRTASATAMRSISVAVWGAGALLLPLLQPAVWLHVTSFEVYPLAWCVVGAAVAAWAGLAGGRRIAALVLLTGVGCGVHVEAAAFAALGVVAAVGAEAVALRRRNLRPGDAVRGIALPLAVGGALGLVALLGLAYLPLAAARHPPLDWGAVRSVDAFVAHLSAATIRGAFADQMGAQGGRAVQALWQLLARNASLLAVPALIGCVSGWTRAPAATGAVLAVIGLDALYSVTLNPMGLRDDQSGLLVLIGIGTLAAWGLDALLRVAPAGVGRALVAAGVLGFVVTQAQRTLEARPAADAHAAATWRDGILRHTAPGALAITASDAASAACAWRQIAEGGRPDMAWLPGVFARDARMLAALAARPGLEAFGAAAAVAAAGPGPGEVRGGDTERFAARLLGAWLRPMAAARPVAWEAGLATEDAQVRPLYLPGLPFGRLEPGGVSGPARRRALQGLRTTVDATIARVRRGEPAGSRVPPTLAMGLGTALSVAATGAARTDPDIALPLALAAVELAPREARVLNNAAALLMAPATARRALGLAEEAADADPMYVRAHRTAARAAVLARQADRAELHAAAWVQVRSGDPTLGAWLDELATLAEPALGARLRALAPTPLPAVGGATRVDKPQP